MHIIDLQHTGKSNTIAAFLIPSAEGLILVETGPHSTAAKLRAGVEAAGYAFEDIRHVLLTHIHLDHAGGAWDLAARGAKIYVHPAGAGHLANPEKLTQSARRIYQDMMDVLWGAINPIDTAQIHQVADQETLSLGGIHFKAHHTPGHAIHHIAYQWEDAIFTGDIAGVHIGSPESPVIAPLPPPDIHIAQWHQSIQLLRDLKPSRFFLTHFGEVNDILPHLERLEHNITTQAEWVRIRLGQGQSIAEMTPAFDAFCVEDLRKQGVSDEAVAQYQAANPAWMSVAGLVRYWQQNAPA